MPSFLKELPADGQVHLPCGTTIDLLRPRWDGPLSAHEVAACRAAGIALAYDPVQIGWVLASRMTREEFARQQYLARRQPRRPAPQASKYTLRPWRDDDLDSYVELLDDPAVWAYMTEPYPAPLGRDMAQSLLELSHASNHHEVRAIIMGDRPVGQVRLHFSESDSADAAEISYWIGRAHWGKGIASEVVGPYTRHSYDRHPQLERIYARVHPDNTASARVLEKSGYRLGGADPRREGWHMYRHHREAAQPLH